MAVTFIVLMQSFASAAQFNNSGFSLQRITAGLDLPTAIAFHPDGRIFIAQKNGVVRIWQDGSLLASPFVTIGEVNNHRDRGLIGIAIDPEFDSNRFVYLAYTYDSDPADLSGPKTARVVRYTADGNTAIASSRFVLLGTVVGTPSAPACADYAADADCIASDSITHTVGGLRFGPDNKLYVAIGDGAGFSGVDLNAFRAQDLDNMSGKILRVERDGSGVVDNPFYTGNADQIRSKIWAYGFRNPFRFNFHPNDGRLIGGDVGWATREEVNLIVAGNNYGWPCREGSAATGGGYAELTQCLQGGGYTDPIHDYLHVNRRGAVVGGAFAINPAYPSWLRGSYVFADFSFGNLQYLTFDAQGNVSVASELATDLGGPVEIVTAPDGFVYYLSISAGELYRINYSSDSSQTPPVASAGYETSNAAPLTVTFDASDSTAGSAITDYVWNFGDGNTGRGVTPTHTYENTGDYPVTLTVTTADNLSDSVTFTVTVNDNSGTDSQPFLVSLTSTETTVVIGAQIAFQAELGNAVDGAPFSVLFTVVDADNQSAREYRFDSIQLSAGATTTYEFSWLPVNIGKYNVSVSFYRDGTNNLLQPPTENAREVRVVARSTPSLALGGGALNPLGAFIVLISVVVWRNSRRRSM
jgi:glucose/arabinose dehydrogenase